MGEHLTAGPEFLDVVGPLAGLVAVVGYGWLVRLTRRRGWPRRRTVAWTAGTLAAVVAVTGPLADAADASFSAHMATHLLLGMVAPLLLALGAPVTLLLRALPVAGGRRLSGILGARPVRFLTEPVVAATLDVGGLWLLYATPLYAAAGRLPLVHVLVHAHVFAAGYLFTVAMVSVDPMPHRRSQGHRLGVLVLALAAHDILAKYLYAHPPAGVAQSAAENGALLMYYGGDAVDLVLVTLVCARWYRTTQPRPLVRHDRGRSSFV